MRKKSFSAAIDDALAQAMAEDPRILILGEDVQVFRTGLFTRFGPKRVRSTPISESAFLGAAVTASMAGLRPVVELWMVDFIAVAIDALLNHAAKVKTFSGGKRTAPLVVRAPCGGGYGDGGQHEQCLWGWLAHIPGLAVVVPSTPEDAGGLMLTALQHDGPVVFLEHKLLSEKLLDYLGTGGRKNIELNIPKSGSIGPVPKYWDPLPLGAAALRREGKDITMVSLGVSVHRCLEAAQILEKKRISASIIDLRSVAPLDKKTILNQASQTKRLLVVDEDYISCGLSGEIAALVAENGIPASFGRVCTQETIPFARAMEDQTLPNTQRIISAAEKLCGK